MGPFPFLCTLIFLPQAPQGVPGLLTAFARALQNSKQAQVTFPIEVFRVFISHAPNADPGCSHSLLLLQMTVICHQEQKLLHMKRSV